MYICVYSWSVSLCFQSTRAFVRTCLEKCNSLKSVAFPALGTGNLGYPPHEAAKIMYEEVEKFSKSKTTSLRDVMFVIYDDSVLQVSSWVYSKL
jgi:poly [ADP-ribose] polymerase 10/14/15